MAAKKKSKQVKITLRKSVIGSKPKHRATVKALGLGKINSEVVKDSNPAIVGMANSISHLVDVEEIK